MSIEKHVLDDPVKSYDLYGFSILPVYSAAEKSIIEKFTKDWLYGILSQWSDEKLDNFDLGSYHKWFNSLGIQHESIFKSHIRHSDPSTQIKNTILNKKLMNFFSNLCSKGFNIWDEGLGWLAFRFIRPGMNDGYPFSKKEWGPAKKVLSAWIPVIGYSHDETITVVPGSHKKEYRKYMPENSKFNKNEYRLVDLPAKSECFSPELKQGEIVVFHPRLLHTEDVISSNVTRLNLEFRIQPIE